MRARQRAALATVAVVTGALLVGPMSALPAGAVGVQVAEKPNPGRRAEKPSKPGKPQNKPQNKPGKPGNKQGGDDRKRKPKPKRDRTPPATPVLGGPGVAAGGAVSLPIIAEPGSYVVVAAVGGSVVATGTGVGAYSSLSWRTTNGRHTYVVTATDAAGNRSGSAQTTVIVDAVPPRLRDVRVEPGTSEDTRARLRFTTDPGSGYRVLVGGRQVASGRTDRSRSEALLDLADGRQRVTLLVRDDVGNTRAATRRVTVRIPEFTVKSRFTSEPTTRTQVLRVRATPTATRGVVRLRGLDPVSFVMRRGSADVRLSLEDGTYRRGAVVVRATHGRSGSVRIPPVTVDTSPPVLEVAPDQKAAADGSLGAAVTAEEDATVRWRLLDPSSKDVVTSGELTAEDGKGTLTADVDKGSYRLVASATDAFGRTTTVRTAVEVADDPVPIWLLVLFGAILSVGAVLAVVGLVLLVRWARRPDSPARRGLAAVRGLAERRRRILLGVGPEETAAGAGIELFEPEQTPARVPQPRVPSSSRGSLPAADQVLHRTQVRLYETAEEHDDELLLGSRTGELLLTREQLAVVDDRTGDVWSVRIAQLAHIGDDTTMVLPAGEDAWVGLVYADRDVTRPALDLVAAHQQEQHLTRS